MPQFEQIHIDESRFKKLWSYTDAQVGDIWAAFLGRTPLLTKRYLMSWQAVRVNQAV